MKKSLLSIVFVASTYLIQAQSVSYRIKENNVSDIKRISIHVNPFYSEIYGGVNFATIGAGIGAEVAILKRIELKGDFRMAYFDGNSGLGEKSKVTGLLHPTCKGGTKRTTYFEGGGALYFFDWTKTRNLKVTLHSSSSGRYTYTESINVPGNRRRMFGARSGIIMYNTGTQIGENVSLGSKDATYLIKSGSDTMTVGDPTAPKVDGSDVTYVNTMVNSTIFYGGISLKSITNLIITADGYGTKKHMGVYDIYVDYLVCPYVSLKDVYTNGGQKWDVGHTKAGFKASGWRFGVSYRSVTKVGFCYKFEVGERPGLYFGEKDKLLKGNVNALISIGCNIPFSKKIVKS